MLKLARMVKRKENEKKGGEGGGGSQSLFPSFFQFEQSINKVKRDREAFNRFSRLAVKL